MPSLEIHVGRNITILSHAGCSKEMVAAYASFLASIRVYRYFVGKGISPLGKGTQAFFSLLTNSMTVCLQRRANADLSQSTIYR